MRRMLALRKAMQMREFTLDHKAMGILSPGIVRDYETDPDPASGVSYFLAVAVLPGAEAIPMDVESDPNAIRLWMERSLLFQARAYAPGGRNRIRAIRGHVPIPSVVSALVHALAEDEVRTDPRPATLNARLNARLSDPARDPAPVPRPIPRPVPMSAAARAFHPMPVPAPAPLPR